MKDIDIDEPSIYIIMKIYKKLSAKIRMDGGKENINLRK